MDNLRDVANAPVKLLAEKLAAADRMDRVLLAIAVLECPAAQMRRDSVVFEPLDDAFLHGGVDRYMRAYKLLRYLHDASRHDVQKSAYYAAYSALAACPPVL